MMSIFILLLGWIFEYQLVNIILSIIAGTGCGYVIGRFIRWPRSRAGERWAILLMLASPFLGYHTNLIEFNGIIIHCNIFLFSFFLIMSVRRSFEKKAEIVRTSFN